MRWSQEETDFLLSIYSSLKKEIILDKLPNRNWDVIKSKARALNVRRKGRPWSNAELKILKENFGKIKYQDIKKLIPNHSIYAISCQAYQLGLTKRSININKLNEFEKGWISALIDGEGTLTIHTERTKSGLGCHPRLMIGNTNFSLLSRAKSVIGSGHISSLDKTKNNGKDFWCFELSTGPLKPLLKQISEFLIVKNYQAKILLRVTEINKKYAGGKRRFITLEEKQELEELTKEIRRLNKRGKTFL